MDYVKLKIFHAIIETIKLKKDLNRSINPDGNFFVSGM